MRRRTFVLIVSLALFSWAAVTYHLFLQRPQGKAQRSSHLSQQLEHLEKELQDQLKSNRELLLSLRNLKTKIFNGGKNDNQNLQQNITNIRQSEDLNPYPVIGVLVFACNRITVKRNLDQLIKFRPSPKQFPIVVSQDCGHEPTTKAIRSYGDQLTLIQQPDQSDIPLTGKEKKFKGYYKIARHYGWALNKTFHDIGYDTIIIVEDDLDIAPDFFEYFLALHPILKSDQTLWCISAWNDNGKDGMVANEPALLYRSDFFPGLGWMLTKDLWSELQSKWPKAGLFYEKHLKFIKLNDKFVPFTKKDLSYLKKDNYDVAFVKQIYGSPAVSLQQLQKGSIDHSGPVRVTYDTKEFFKKASKALGLMDDFKSGVPRTGYRGVVSFLYKGRRVYLAPPADWKGYDPSWS
ncbi:alpha-1,3-mannosyl-glycoprotein 2-beta-N-acetylglucosaminyltransferase-like [Centruroides sculpturatus]|uniref:alpha-1,3-mannosyl-glycoprotein 2-beta-N-acetylglucosaminyltransferase-like n=1 Tax=Centruroides sculpturatus TaxID=218467 RepID=UPI000C6D0D1C|nr:alpha-1,3-mannosyl-glycoprotein 2-beta-N-acetylglucosaminyltransferase-like [Centruroides sculpturatus]